LIDGQTLTPAPARSHTRGITPRKLSVAAELALREPEDAAAQIRWMEAIGEDGGHLTEESSPHVMWLAGRLARAAR
jgi:hypothetical protein